MNNKNMVKIKSTPLLTMIGFPGMALAVIATRMDDGVFKYLLMSLSVIFIILAGSVLGMILIKLKGK